MSRRKAREMAVQALYQLDFNQINVTDAMQAVFDEQQELTDNTRQYAETLITGAQNKIHEIDAVIAGVATDWKLNRMASVDRNIARLAVYEMNFSDEKIPPNVIINEAVELAKTFGTEDSSRFVNGILGALVKRKAE